MHKAAFGNAQPDGGVSTS